MVADVLPGARPSPFLSSRNQLRTQRVSLYVPTYREKVAIVLRGQRFVAALIDGAATGRTPVHPPALAVRQREPVHESRQVSILVGSKYEMKMIGHQTVREDAYWDPTLRLHQRAETCVVVFWHVEEVEMLDRSIDHVKDESCSLRF